MINGEKIRVQVFDPGHLVAHTIIFPFHESVDHQCVSVHVIVATAAATAAASTTEAVASWREFIFKKNFIFFCFASLSLSHSIFCCKDHMLPTWRGDERRERKHLSRSFLLMFVAVCPFLSPMWDVREKRDLLTLLPPGKFCFHISPSLFSHEDEEEEGEKKKKHQHRGNLISLPSPHVSYITCQCICVCAEAEIRETERMREADLFPSLSPPVYVLNRKEERKKEDDAGKEEKIPSFFFFTLLIPLPLSFSCLHGGEHGHGKKGKKQNRHAI